MIDCRHYNELTGECDEMEYGIDIVWCEQCPYTNEKEMKSCECYDIKETNNNKDIKVK